MPIENEKIKIALYMLDGPCLIVEHPTGVEYTNQTNGIFIQHRDIEGYIVPVTVRTKKLPDIFNPMWWELNGPCERWMNPLSKRIENDPNYHYDNNEAIAWAIERWFQKEAKGSVFALEVLKDHDNTEAWYHVQVKFFESDEWHKAILTWENCD